MTIGRDYDRLQVLQEEKTLPEQVIPCPGMLEIKELSLRILCRPAAAPLKTYDAFTVAATGPVTVGPRRPGDAITLAGGSKSLKKLFIDRKIPAAQRNLIPVLRDQAGILGVYKIGADCRRLADTLPAVELRFESM